MGSPLRGRGFFVLDRNEGFVSPFGSGTVMYSWLTFTPLSAASLRLVPLSVLPGGPRCVQELRLSLAPSSVLLCPMLGLSLASKTLAKGLGLSLVPCPTFCWLGFVPRSMPQLCALQPLAPPFQRYVRFRIHLLCSALCLQVVFWAWSLLLWVRLRPLPDNSLGTLGLPERLL